MLAQETKIFQQALENQPRNQKILQKKQQYNCNEIEQAAKDAGYLIKSQVIYPTMNHLRITLGPPDQMQSFIKAIDWCFETK